MDILQHILSLEPQIRLSAFLGVFVIMAGFELFVPRRPLNQPKKKRWAANITIVLINTVVARTVLPVAPIAFAAYLQDQGLGLFNNIGFGGWGELITTVILMDFAIWGQHLMVHAVPLFWKLHRVHHTDMDYDVTTGLRFHPLEIILSLLIKFAVIAILGASPVGVLMFEIILNAMAMFNHANVRLPLKLDAVLRVIFVTPDFHRVHHSILMAETNSNYGFNLSLWDRLFGTYVSEPQLGHNNMTIGLNVFRNPTEQRLDKMLTQPFRSTPEPVD